MSLKSVVLDRGRRPFTAAMALSLIGLMIFAAVAWRYHTVLHAETRDRATRLSLLLSEQAARTFEAVDFTLRGFEPLVATTRGLRDDQTIDVLLRRRAAELTFVQTIRVLDERGRVVAASDPAALGTLDPGCVAALVSPQGGALAIGCSVGDVGSKGWPAIPVARRLSDGDGRFVGVIVADIDPGYFSRFFSNLELGTHTLVTLSESHGHVLLASTRPPGQSQDPMPSTLVPPTDQTRLSELARASRGLMTAVHQAGGYPLSILVGMDRADINRRWWQVIGPSLALALAAAALLLGLALMDERYRAERRRASQRAMAAQKLEAMGQMTATVAHDFRNILTALDGSLRLVRRRGPTPAVLDEAAATLMRGNAMVDRLLAFSRRQELQPEPHDVNALLADIGPTLRHVAGPDTRVVIGLAPDLPFCRIDRVQFEAALMNLVVNARQAMDAGGTITIASRLGPSDVVSIAVTDTGCGIDQAVLKRVFEPFFTTKAQTGTGLGLAQVQAFVGEIGGRVTLDSTVGQGTTVTLHLPALPVSESVPMAEPALTGDPV